MIMNNLPYLWNKQNNFLRTSINPFRKQLYRIKNVHLHKIAFVNHLHSNFQGKKETFEFLGHIYYFSII